MLKVIWLIAYIGANGYPAFASTFYFDDEAVCQGVLETVAAAQMPRDRLWEGCVAVELPDVSGEGA